MTLKNVSLLLASALLCAGQEHDPLHMREPGIGDGTICRIFSTGTPRERLCAPEGDGGAGGAGGAGGDDADKPKFTQKDVDKLIGVRIGEATKKFGDYDTLKTQAAKAAELQAERDALLEEKTNQGKTAEEKAAAAANKAAQALERERGESATKLTAAEKRAEAAEKALRTERIGVAVQSALSTAKALPQALQKAAALLMAEAEFEMSDDGKVVSVTYGGVAHKTVADAATAFLKDNDFLAAAPTGGGGGTKRPNAGGTGGVNLYDKSTDELLASSAQQR